MLALGQSSPGIGFPTLRSFQSEFIPIIAARVIPLQGKREHFISLLKTHYGFLENKLNSLQ